MKLIKIALVSLCVLSLSTEILARSSVSSSRSSVSVSRPSVSTTRSYSRPVSKPTYQASKPRVVPVRRTTALRRRNKPVEYDYYDLRDCDRIIKPINGYRCIDRD